MGIKVKLIEMLSLLHQCLTSTDPLMEYSHVEIIEVWWMYAIWHEPHISYTCCIMETLEGCSMHDNLMLAECD
jgi:hypothetical protein